MSDGKIKSAPLAYQNEGFLNSPDGRILRLLSEYAEPLSRFRREQIQDTVVFFGSARFHSRAASEANLIAVEGATHLSSADREAELKRARAAVNMIASSVGQSAGIGFAIPINTAKAVLNDLVTLGRVRRPALGVKTIPLDPELADQMGLSIDYGLLIVQAIQGGSADRAGLRGGTERAYLGNMCVKRSRSRGC